MALKLASAVPTRNSTVQVKDAALSTGLFSDYQPIPGVSGFNLPSNARTPTEVSQLGGTAQLAGDPDPGEIAVTLAALHRNHPSIELLYDNQESDKILDFRFETQPQSIGTIADALVVAAGALNTVAVPSAEQDDVTALLKEGMVFVHSNTIYKIAKITEGTGSSAGKVASFQFAPAATAAIAATDLVLWIPGGRNDVRCTVLGMPKGDVQGGAAVAGEVSLGPTESVGKPTAFTS